MKGQWGLIYALFLALVIAIFSVVNVNSVTFNYVFGKTEWPLILIILGSVFMGALVVGLIGAVKVYQLRKQIKRLERDIAAQKQMSNQGVEERDTDNLSSPDEQLEENKDLTK